MKVIKRNGELVNFDRSKIYIAILGAFRDEKIKGAEKKTINILELVLNEISKLNVKKISVEKIQDIVEDVLMTENKKVAKAYIIYREKRNIERKNKNNIFKQMDDIVNLTSEDIRDNANKAGDKLTSLRAMFSDVVCKEYSSQRVVPKHLQEEQEKLIYEHDRTYRNIPFTNCFSGDTEFITNYGVMQFKDCFDGQEVEILDKNGKWRKATVKNYGKQDLYKITLQSGRTVKEIKATLNHRWVLKDGSITTELKINDKLYLLNETEINELNDEMFCLGFILGDGSDYIANNDGKTEGVRCRLCGDKKVHLNKFVKCGYKVSEKEFDNGDVQVFKKGLAFKKSFIENKTWKILSKKDKISLFIGYYSADGFKDRNGIATSNKHLAEMIREISALAGYHITSEKYEIRNTQFKENAELYTFRFMKSQPTNRNWIVKNVEKFNSQKYEVWCVEEPVTKTFTLNGGIVTGNCCLVNYKDMLENGFHVGQTYIHDIKSITTAIAILSQIIAHVSSGQYGGVTLQRIDERLEPYMKMSYEKHLMVAVEEGIEDIEGYAWRRLEKEVYDACQGLEYEINTLTNSRAEVPFITISIGLGTSKFSQMFQMQYLKNRQAGFDGKTPVFPKLVFITKKGLNLYPDDPQYYIFKEAIKTSSLRLYPDYQSYENCIKATGSFKTSMGCRSYLSSQNLDTESDGGFNQGVCSINLVRCAILADGNEQEFYKNLDKALDLSFESLMLRHKMLCGVKAKQNPILFCEGAFARLDPEETINKLLTKEHSSISIGYVGLHNCMIALYGNSYYESEFLLQKGLNIIQYMRDYCDKKKEETNIGFSLYSTPAEVLATKFCRSDVKDFGEIEGVTTKGYYENSFHYPSDTDVSPFAKINFECQFPYIANGGHIQYVEFGDMTKNLQALETVVRYAMEKTPYFGVNVRNDVCLECGYHGLMENLDECNNNYRCPNCGNEDKTKMSIVIRLCGYISSISERPSVDGKMKEIHSRVTHIGERK